MSEYLIPGDKGLSIIQQARQLEIACKLIDESLNHRPNNFLLQGVVQKALVLSYCLRERLERSEPNLNALPEYDNAR